MCVSLNLLQLVIHSEGLLDYPIHFILIIAICLYAG